MRVQKVDVLRDSLDQSNDDLTQKIKDGILPKSMFLKVVSLLAPIVAPCVHNYFGINFIKIDVIQGKIQLSYTNFGVA